MRPCIFILGLFLAALCRVSSAPAETLDYSGISFFRTDITVNEDATLEIREDITVKNASAFYKYGFRRDLPIGSADRWDSRYVGEYKQDNGVRIDVLEVTQDGKPARYDHGSGYGYSQLLIGKRGVPLDPGVHRYVIRYVVYSALNLTNAGDTLYWNAIGHERDAPVADTILAVHLPAAVPTQSVQAEPRVAGRGVSFPRQSETGLKRVEGPSGAIVFRATNVEPRQSLSLVLTWPSGYIHKSKLDVLRRDKWLLAAPALLFLFYFIAWLWIGPEPRSGPVVTQYEPPEGLSAAAVRYIATDITDGRSFAAVIAALAVRRCIRVEPVNGNYRCSRLMSDRRTEAALAPEEKRVLNMLFEDEPVLELSPAMDQRTTAQHGRYVFHIHQELTKQLGGKYLTHHSGIIALGVLATFAFALPLAVTAQGRDPSGAIFFTVWVLFGGLMIGLLVELSFVSFWKNVVRTRTGWPKLIPGTLAIAAFTAVIAYFLTKLAAGVSLSFALMLVAFLAINLGWGPRLKRETLLGRKTCDQIAGFRQFLEKVEQEPLNRLNPAQQPLVSLERFLPFAIALEIKEAWGDHLTQTFCAATVSVEE